MNERKARMTLETLSVLAGLIAAILWWWSASVPLPAPPGAAFGGVSETDPFYQALILSARLNAWAAIATGLSVCLGVMARGVDQMADIKLIVRDILKSIGSTGPWGVVPCFFSVCTAIGLLVLAWSILCRWPVDDIKTVFAMISTFCAMSGTWYWYCSSKVDLPVQLDFAMLTEGMGDVSLAPLVQPMMLMARLNKYAAWWTMASVIAGLLGVGIGVLAAPQCQMVPACH
jgi:hypothetical protein